MVEFAQEADEEDASGNVTQLGHPDPVRRRDLEVVPPGLHDAEPGEAHQRGRQRDLLRHPRRSNRCSTGSTCRKHKSCSRASSTWGTAPKEFIEGERRSCGPPPATSPTSRKNAKFAFGVACCLRPSSAARPPAAATSTSSRRPRPRARGGVQVRQVDDRAERAAEWSIETGYVAPAPDAWRPPVMKKYVAGLPAGRGRARPAAVLRAEFSTHDGPRVDEGARGRDRGGDHRHEDARARRSRTRRPKRRGSCAATSADSGPTTPRRDVPVMKGSSHDDLESRWVGWRCSCRRPRSSPPSPTIRRSRRSSRASSPTPSAGRPARFIGLENYAAMVDDPVFWRRSRNNVWFALGTIPLSIALALAHGALGQRRAARPRRWCGWRTSRRPCCR